MKHALKIITFINIFCTTLYQHVILSWTYHELMKAISAIKMSVEGGWQKLPLDTCSRCILWDKTYQSQACHCNNVAFLVGMWWPHSINSIEWTLFFLNIYDSERNGHTFKEVFKYIFLKANVGVLIPISHNLNHHMDT